MDIMSQMDNIENNSYQVLITGITWNKTASYKYADKKIKVSDLPDTFTLDLPDNVLNQANKKQNNFNDVIESFCYNFLTHKFGHEVYHCQIWLPLDK